MNILMVTNTYIPHVGGVAKSIAAFTETYRELGHRVMVIGEEWKIWGNIANSAEAAFTDDNSDR